MDEKTHGENPGTVDGTLSDRATSMGSTPENALVALARASLKAREKACRTQGFVEIFQDGEIVRVFQEPVAKNGSR